MRILYHSKARLVCLGAWVACWIRHLRARLTRARNARCWMISCGSFVRASGDLHFFWTFVGVGHLIPLPLPNHLVFFFRIFPQPTQFHAYHSHFISFQFISILHLPPPSAHCLSCISCLGLAFFLQYDVLDTSLQLYYTSSLHSPSFGFPIFSPFHCPHFTNPHSCFTPPFCRLRRI